MEKVAFHSISPQTMTAEQTQQIEYEERKKGERN